MQGSESLAVQTLERYRRCNNKDKSVLRDTRHIFREILDELEDSGPSSSTLYDLLTDYHVEWLLRDDDVLAADTADVTLRAAIRRFPDELCFTHKLVVVLRTRFERLGNIDILNEARTLTENAIVHVQDPAGRSTASIQAQLLAENSNLLLLAADVENYPEHIDVAIELLRTAINCQTLTACQQFVMLHNLAEAFRRRFEFKGDIKDLRAATDMAVSSKEPPDLARHDFLYTILIKFRVGEQRFQYYGRYGEWLLGSLHIGWEHEILLEYAPHPVVLAIWQLDAHRVSAVSCSKPQDEIIIHVALHSAIIAYGKWGSINGPRNELAKFYLHAGHSNRRRHSNVFSPGEIDTAIANYERAVQLSSPGSSSHHLAVAYLVDASFVRCALSEDPVILDEIRTLVARTEASGVELMMAKGLLEVALAKMEYYTYLWKGESLDQWVLSHSAKSLVHYDEAYQFFQIDFNRRGHCVSDSFSITYRKADHTRDPRDIMAAQNYLVRVNEFEKVAQAKIVDFEFDRAQFKALQFRAFNDMGCGLDALRMSLSLTKDPNVSQSRRTFAAVLALEMTVATSQTSIASTEKMFECLDILLDLISESEPLIEVVRLARMLSPLVPIVAASALEHSARSITIEDIALKVFPHWTHTGSLILKFKEFCLDFARRLASKHRIWWINIPVPLSFVLYKYESVRTIVWKRLLEQRADLWDLESEHPGYATQLREVRDDLMRIDSEHQRPGRQPTFAEIFHSDRWSAGRRYHEVLARLRQRPGFEEFPSPLSQSFDFRSLATKGPIVTFVHGVECNVILITSRHIDHMYLPDFDDSQCKAQYERMREAVSSKDPGTCDVVDDILCWLWNAAAKPVLSRLGLLLPHTNNHVLPRIWWVTSGWINLLPIHAAGDHRQAAQTGEKCSVIDFTTPSYTPSLPVLASSRHIHQRMTNIKQPGPLEQPIALLAAMKVTPDVEPDLPNARRELEAVGRLLSAQYACESFAAPAPERRDVVLGLRKCTVAHLIAHGSANFEDPLRTIIYLDDWKRRPLSVKYLMRMAIDTCQLVFLSGCEMAASKDILLKDEGFHIAGALQMAGVPTTIATWWRILDSVATDVATEFYQGLTHESNVFDLDRSAVSLRDVMLRKRAENHRSLHWGAYVHFGV